MKPITFITLTAGLLLFVTGCKNQQKIPQAGMGYGQPTTTATTPSTTPAQTTATQATKPKLPPIKPITASELMPAQNQKGEYRTEEGKNNGKTFPFTYEKTPKGYILTINGLRRVYYEWNSNHDLILKRDDDFQENVRVVYNPGLTILPANIDKNEPNVSSTSQVNVYNLTNGHRRAFGKVSNRLSAIWQSQVSLDSQKVGVYIVREERALDLDMAMVKVTLDTAYAPTHGEVLQMEWRTQKALNLFIENSKYKMILATPLPEPQPSQPLTPSP